MKKIRTLIVDDEPLAREGVRVLLGEDPEVEVIGDCADGESALSAIRKGRPDIVFLDVHMPQLGGLEVYGLLAPEERPSVVFVTAYDHYAVKAFEMCAVDYLLKPFRDARFRTALGRAKEQVRRADFTVMQQQAKCLLEHLKRIESDAVPTPAPAETPLTSRLVFKVGSEHVFSQPSEIIWIEAHGELIKLRTVPNTHLVREPLHVVEKRLDPRLFVRTHRSFIVNASHVKKIVPLLYGDHEIVMRDGTRLRLSRTYRDKLKSLLAKPAKA